MKNMDKARVFAGHRFKTLNALQLAFKIASVAGVASLDKFDRAELVQRVLREPNLSVRTLANAFPQPVIGNGWRLAVRATGLRMPLIIIHAGDFSRRVAKQKWKVYLALNRIYAVGKAGNTTEPERPQRKLPCTNSNLNHPRNRR